MNDKKKLIKIDGRQRTFLELFHTFLKNILFQFFLIQVPFLFFFPDLLDEEYLFAADK